MTTVVFQPTFRPHLKTGTITATMPFHTNPAIGYAWIRAGLSIYTMRARFDGNGRILATAPDGTDWQGEGWTDAQGLAA